MTVSSCRLCWLWKGMWFKKSWVYLREYRNLRVPERIIKLDTEKFKGYQCGKLQKLDRETCYLHYRYFIVIMDIVLGAATWDELRGIVWSQTEWLGDLNNVDGAHTNQNLYATLNNFESDCVLLYGYKTWFVTNEVKGKLQDQDLVNR
jgi:hypothetical protein